MLLGPLRWGAGTYIIFIEKVAALEDLDEGVLQQLADYDLYIIVDDSAAQKDHWSDVSPLSL